MQILESTGTIIAVAVIVGVLIVAAITALIVARAWIKVARADEALVISGKSQKDEAGDAHATTVVVNGKALVNPISQRFEVISLRSRQVNMRAEAQSNDNVTLSVEAVALVKIGSNPAFVRRAAERFASQDEAIENFTQDQLEGALRGVIAQQSVISLMRDRKEFSEEIARSVTPELEEQGLILDSFQIRGITDAVGYIQSLGAPEIEAKRQAAEISQTNAQRAIAKEQITNQEANLVEQTQLDRNTANSNAQVGRARAEAEQAEALAGEKARQQVLQQQAENRQAQLDADVKRVADAERYKRQQEAEANAFQEIKRAEADAQQERTRAEARALVAKSDAEAVRLRAEAEAEAVRLQGEARAFSIKAEADALRENQEALLATKALEQLPTLMQAFAEGYGRIGKVTHITSGGSGTGSSDAAGGSGTVGSQFAGENAAAMSHLFESIRAVSGLDLAALIQGRAVGQAQGEGFAQGTGGSPAPAKAEDEAVTDLQVSRDSEAQQD